MYWLFINGGGRTENFTNANQTFLQIIYENTLNFSILTGHEISDSKEFGYRTLAFLLDSFHKYSLFFLKVEIALYSFKVTAEHVSNLLLHSSAHVNANFRSCGLSVKLLFVTSQLLNLNNLQFKEQHPGTVLARKSCFCSGVGIMAMETEKKNPVMCMYEEKEHSLTRKMHTS